MKKDNDIKYCVCTEGTDFTFPYLRVMLLSLFKHNPWIEGDVVILTCDLTPLSNHNREILNEICQNIKYVNIETRQFKSFNLKSSNRNAILTNLYRINAFSLHGFDFVLYINSMSLCISSITGLFIGESDVIATNSGYTILNKEPGKKFISKTVFNSSLMIISRDTLNMELKDKMLDRLKTNRNITNLDISSSIHDILKLNGNNINYHSVNTVVKKSKYNDSKFKTFSSIQKNVIFIELDIGINEKKKTPASFMFKKMNQLWNSYNIQGEWNSEETPSGIVNMNAYVDRVYTKRLKNRGINKKSRVELRTDSSINNTEYDSDFCIMITTYNRKKCVEKLTRNLKKMGNCKIVVIDDASTQDIDTSNIDDYTKLNTNNGKKGWWKTVNLLWGKAALYNCKYYIMLPDDALPNEDMFNEAIRLWESIKDPSKIAMHLANNNREKNWTNYSRTNYNSEIFKTQTTEFSFICKKEFIRYIIPPINPYRWRKNKLLGSGVGDSLNKYWVSKKKNIYGVKKSMISKNKDCPHSLMNPEARKKNPWIIK